MDYLDRKGQPISELQWANLKATPGYCGVRNYLQALGVSTDGRRVAASISWHGRAPKPFILVTDTKSGEFATEKEAIDAYEDYLVTNEAGEWFPSAVTEFNFVEFHNCLVGPGKRESAFVEKIVQNADYASW